jgi:hypothetical protein
VLRAEAELGDEAVDFVEHEDGLKALLPCLAEDSVGLDADALAYVDKDDAAIGEASGSGDFGTEVDVARGIEKVERVLIMEKGDSGCLHGDLA